MRQRLAQLIRRLARESSQQHAGRAKQQRTIRRDPAFQSNLVTDRALPDALPALVRDALGNRHRANPSRLRAHDRRPAPVLPRIVQDVLRHLRRLTATRRPGDEHDLIRPHRVQYRILKLPHRQLFTFRLYRRQRRIARDLRSQARRSRLRRLFALAATSHLQRRLHVPSLLPLPSRVPDRRFPRRVHRSAHARSDLFLALRRELKVSFHRRRRASSDAQIKQILRVLRHVRVRLRHVHPALGALPVGLALEPDLLALGVDDGAEVIIDVGREDEFRLVRVAAKRVQSVGDVNARELAHGTHERSRRASTGGAGGGATAASTAASTGHWTRRASRRGAM